MIQGNSAPRIAMNVSGSEHFPKAFKNEAANEQDNRKKNPCNFFWNNSLKAGFGQDKYLSMCLFLSVGQNIYNSFGFHGQQ